MRITIGLSIALLVITSGCASAPTTPDRDRPEPGAPASAEDEPYAAAPESVTYDDLGHEMDIYLPDDNRRPTTMVMLVHGVGGGDSPKDHPGFVAWGTRLSKAGMVAAVPNYDAVVGGSDVGQDQLGQAIAVLRERVTGMGGEQAALATMGFSAGGADWVAASFDPANQPVDALVGYYAEIEPPRDSDETAQRSLSARLAASDKPLLLAYGLNDTAPHILSSFRAFRRRFSEGGSTTTFLTHSTAGHAFDLSDDPRTREIIRRTVEFIARAHR